MSNIYSQAQVKPSEKGNQKIRGSSFQTAERERSGSGVNEREMRRMIYKCDD